MDSISLHNCSWMWRSTKSVWPVITKCNLYLGRYLTSVRQSNSSRSQLWYQWLAFRLSCNRRKWNHKDLCLSCRYVVTKDIDILLDYLFYQSSPWLVLFMFHRNFYSRCTVKILFNLLACITYHSICVSLMEILLYLDKILSKIVQTV